MKIEAHFEPLNFWVGKEKLSASFLYCKDILAIPGSCAPVEWYSPQWANRQVEEGTDLLIKTSNAKFLLHKNRDYLHT